MANNQSDFSRKFRELCRNRAVIVTTVTLLVVAGIVVAATLSANRAKRPLGGDSTGSLTVTDIPGSEAAPSGKEEVTLPTYNGGETQPVGGDAEEPDAMLDLPVSGQLLKGHDATLQVYSNTMGDYRVHLGIDIATAPEAPVMAAADGKVEKIWEDALMGTCVALTHGEDTVTVYKNLAKAVADGITVGAEVKKGQQIGNVGDTAVIEMADEPHLHFEMTVGGLSVDPLKHFSAKDVEILSKDTAYESDAMETTAADTATVTNPNGK